MLLQRLRFCAPSDEGENTAYSSYDFTITRIVLQLFLSFRAISIFLIRGRYKFESPCIEPKLLFVTTYYYRCEIKILPPRVEGEWGSYVWVWIS